MFSGACLGLAIGVAAIGVIRLVASAERLSERAGPVVRAGLAGLALAGLSAISKASPTSRWR